MPFVNGEIYSYEEFIKDNKAKVNGYLNLIMWASVLAGPAIALGILIGLFNDITYYDCMDISVVVIVFAIIHTVLFVKFRYSVLVGLFALISIDSILVYLSINHLYISLIWFCVPLLSILFCNRWIYFVALVVNYFTMVIATYITAPYFIQTRSNYSVPSDFFWSRIWGFTIEASIMMLAGILLGKHSISHFKDLIERNNQITDQIKETQEKMDILDSMADIYDYVNLLNFSANTEMSLRDRNRIQRGIDPVTQTHTNLNRKLNETIMPDQRDKFLEFTNISTVRSRLANRKVISSEFVDAISGWFRAQYIAVDKANDGIPNMVIYTVSNIDEEKRREEHLIRISRTDELTRLYNRRCYDEDVADFNGKMIPPNLVIFSADVNGLKGVNDTMGHAAGDELIKGAAECLVSAIGNKGKVYRMGGDEFQAMVFTDNPEQIFESIQKKISGWHGKTVKELHLSVGFAKVEDAEVPNITAIEKVADGRMYADKRAYYQRAGIDRRSGGDRRDGQDRRRRSD